MTPAEQIGATNRLPALYSGAANHQHLRRFIDCAVPVAGGRPRRSANMMKFLLSLIFLCSSLFGQAAESEIFTGTWDDTKAKAVSFTLFLKQEGDQVTGYHTAIILYTRANHVDAILPQDGEPSITGSIIGKKANVKFRSGYGDAKGTAKIEIKDNHIVWTLISASGPDHLFPKHAVLYKQDEKRK